MNRSSLTKAVSKPSHVPQKLVYDFDMCFDPDYVIDPQSRLLALAHEAPAIFWTPRNGGHWIAQTYEANFDIARNADIFSSEMVPLSKIKKLQLLQRLLGFLGIGSGHLPLPYPIMLDPPLHTMYRQPLLGAFSPKSIAQLEQPIRLLARELINAVRIKNGCEFMSAIAEPLPVSMFLQLFGLPVERLSEYRTFFKMYMETGQGETSTAKRLRPMLGIAKLMRDTFIERKRDPKDDIISLLWSTEIDGKPMTLEIMENYGVLMFIAGLDTVMQSIGYAFRHLALDQKLQSALRNHPDLIPEAVEEIMRRYSFVIPPRRIAKDVTFQGVNFAKDDSILLFLPSANLDPQKFKNPEVVDLDRENKTHIAFNAGAHRCLGSHLARLELKIIYEEFLSQIPQFGLVPEKPVAFRCGNIIAIENLHLSWSVN